ncbi:hypothetical protein P171DRAFT_57549 [Karstenula rhodostoma CBS 690.94]|uniref:Uncharacterized protein n=1 Tax=Karstenula rhodostoma CBS 690.94 TaxID=1392251 RepID=A0A9P4PDT5_9PLEO|nr:hypothetical protein P171DRAFT_57549 [Karstenula rhodostoma CBS 690.94]
MITAQEVLLLVCSLKHVKRVIFYSLLILTLRTKSPSYSFLKYTPLVAASYVNSVGGSLPTPTTSNATLPTPAGSWNDRHALGPSPGFTIASPGTCR